MWSLTPLTARTRRALWPSLTGLSRLGALGSFQLGLSLHWSVATHWPLPLTWLLGLHWTPPLHVYVTVSVIPQTSTGGWWPTAQWGRRRRRALQSPTPKT